MRILAILLLPFICVLSAVPEVMAQKSLADEMRDLDKRHKQLTGNIEARAERDLKAYLQERNTKNGNLFEYSDGMDEIVEYKDFICHMFPASVTYDPSKPDAENSVELRVRFSSWRHYTLKVLDWKPGEWSDASKPHGGAGCIYRVIYDKTADKVLKIERRLTPSDVLVPPLDFKNLIRGTLR